MVGKSGWPPRLAGNVAGGHEQAQTAHSPTKDAEARESATAPFLIPSTGGGKKR